MRIPQEPKDRGGYYTPPRIAEFLAAWAVRDLSAAVLEPSAGDGEVAAAAARLLDRHGRITAVELIADEANRTRSRLADFNATIHAEDFFAWFLREQPTAAFDAVVGNPPFIRYQNFPEAHRQAAFRIMRDEGLRPSRLTNAWLPFVVASTLALKPGGRLALVLPAELLQVNYASELRGYLARRFRHLTVITFRCLIFDGIQQETVLLLGERGDSGGGTIRIAELDDDRDLDILAPDRNSRQAVDLDHATEKWTQFYLTPSEIALVRSLESSREFPLLGEIASVDVGIVTGRNEFFVLTPDDAHGLESWCSPLVGRSAQIPGLALRQREWDALKATGGRCLLLDLGDVERAALDPQARTYVEYGEERGFHLGYKCRIRAPRWWAVPSTWPPDAFLLRQIHDAPRVVDNQTGATCTDTIHRVRLLNGTSGEWLAGAFLNSVTAAFAEIRGRSYGGGVLELEPREAEGLPVPPPSVRSPALDETDMLVRRHGVEAGMAASDAAIAEATGLGDSDLHMFRGIWRKLYERRRNRRRR